MKPIVTTQRDTLVKSDTTTKADSTANDLDATSLETGRLNINRASKRQLMLLPGIGPALADRIIAYRTGTGPFSEVDQLLAVKGIGLK